MGLSQADRAHSFATGWEAGIEYFNRQPKRGPDDVVVAGVEFYHDKFDANNPKDPERTIRLREVVQGFVEAYEALVNEAATPRSRRDDTDLQPA